VRQAGSFDVSSADRCVDGLRNAEGTFELAFRQALLAACSTSCDAFAIIGVAVLATVLGSSSTTFGTDRNPFAPIMYNRGSRLCLVLW
jgi:hypothetical protein